MGRRGLLLSWGRGAGALSAAGTVWDRVRGFFRRLGGTLTTLFGE